MPDKVRILLIEDDAAQAQQLQKKLEDVGYAVTAVADNLKDALGAYYAQKPDLVIIDVYLDDKPDGIAFARRINENPHTLKPFVFLTSAADMYTFREAKLTNPYSYLLKPFNIAEIQFAIELAIEKFAGTPGLFSRGSGTIVQDSFFLIKKKDTLVKVAINDIVYCQVEGKYTTVVTENGVFLIESSFKQILQKLPPDAFIQVHRNYIVNVNFIKFLNTTEGYVQLMSGNPIAVSRRFKEMISQKFTVLK